MSDIIPDKVDMFGIFSTNPQRVMLLPGLEVINTIFYQSHLNIGSNFLSNVGITNWFCYENRKKYNPSELFMVEPGY